MKKQLLVLVILISTCFLSGCAKYRFSSDLVSFNQNSKKGIVFGSITFYDSEGKFSTYIPTIKSVTNKKITEFIIQPNGLTSNKHWGELQDGRTYLFAITVNPGSYEINQIRCSSGNFEQSIRNFSIPFSVKSGEIVYMREINIDEYNSTQNNIISLKNEFERDLNGIKNKNFKKKINWSESKQSEIKINIQ